MADLKLSSVENNETRVSLAISQAAAMLSLNILTKTLHVQENYALNV